MYPPFTPTGVEYSLNPPPHQRFLLRIPMQSKRAAKPEIHKVPIKANPTTLLY